MDFASIGFQARSYSGLAETCLRFDRWLLSVDRVVVENV